MIDTASLPPGLRGVCGVGASAGGLEALERFFRSVAPDTGIAYVVVQHLSPDHKSLMAELLARYTPLRVVRVEGGMTLAPDTIYLNPPKTNLTLDGAVLQVADHRPANTLHLPIDGFFASLGHAFGDRAIGVVLSGTGTDGTRGARELKAEGGLVLVQDPTEAQFDGMPRSVASLGLADQVLSAAELPACAVQFLSRAGLTAPESFVAGIEPPDVDLGRVLTLLRDRMGTDFSGYKPAMIVRRIERRMAMKPGLDLAGYCALLTESMPEVQALHRDLLINVTRFFRDEAAFALLQERVVPAILRELPRDREVRIWAPACATGEEAYSLGMLFLDAMKADGDVRDLRIFATDVDADAIAVAAEGLYPESVAADIPPERLAQYFQREADGYRVTRALRERVVFARHNLLKDPPLTRMDFVSCRNMLIYLGADLQRRAIALLAYALRARGFLFLGSSETTGSLSSHFELVDARWKIFQALRPGRQTLIETLPLRSRRMMPPGITPDLTRWAPAASGMRLGRVQEAGDLLERVYQELADAMGMRCIALDGDGRLVHTFGALDDLLHVPAGRSTLDIYRLLPNTLAAPLRTAITRAAREQREVLFSGIDLGAGRQPMALRVRPIEFGPRRERLALVFFEDDEAPLRRADRDVLVLGDDAPGRIAQLEQELVYAREHLQATVEELETSSEELQATNEELLASNEELQSTNEELQSVNEELQTVNAENQEKILELVALNNDVDNLLRATGIGIVFLDHDLRIRKFTSAATRLLHLLPQDTGRPISHIAAALPRLDLVSVARRVLATGAPESRDVMLDGGTVLHLRVLPYVANGPGPGGVIISYVDVTEVKRSERRLQAILDAIPASIAVVGMDGTIVQTNREWEEFGRTNGAEPRVSTGVGLNYLATCVAAGGDPAAVAVARGLRDVLDGVLPRFELEYPCHSPSEQRWFVLQVTPFDAEGVRGAMLQHVNVTSLRRELERVSAQLPRGTAPLEA